VKSDPDNGMVEREYMPIMKTSNGQRRREQATSYISKELKVQNKGSRKSIHHGHAYLVSLC